MHGLVRGQNNAKLDLVHDLVPEVDLHTVTSPTCRAWCGRSGPPNLGRSTTWRPSPTWPTRGRTSFHTTEVTAKGTFSLLEAIRLHTEDDHA